MHSVIISVCSLPTPGQMGCSLCAQSGPRGCESPIVLPSPGKYKTSRAFQFFFIPLLSVPISFWSPGLGKDAEVTAVNTVHPQLCQGPQKVFFFVQTQSPGLGVHSMMIFTALQSLCSRSGPITSSISMRIVCLPPRPGPLCPPDLKEPPASVAPLYLRSTGSESSSYQLPLHP